LKIILHGRVATMDQAFTVLSQGAIYIDGNTIVAVADKAAPPPAGFTGAQIVDTGGTIFPGLVELHNHLSYDALQMWQVPKKFSDRGQWQSNSDYVANVSGPMGVIAKSKDPHLLASLVRYVETKCLLGGVTTTQGISLKGENLDTYYKSAMRVVDDPGDPKFPRASTRIPDVDASDWAAFKKVVDKASCLLLHLSEGLDPQARDAFLALQDPQSKKWAIGPALAGIHCAALQSSDFAVMASKGASTVWSPLSNLLLYGGTTDVKAAREAGVPVALGSDWSPSGSKNLLHELKVAMIVNSVNGIGMADRDLVAMVTAVPASIVKWGALIGSISAGKRADLLVIHAPTSSDPYGSLLQARETDVMLVMIDGRAVVGVKALMTALGQTGEEVSLGSQTRVINYGPGDPRIPAVTFAEARAALTDALNRLPTLLSDEKAGHGVSGRKIARAAAAPQLSLALDEQYPDGFALRPRLPFANRLTGPDAVIAPAAAVVPLKALKLDPVAVAAHPGYGALLQKQINIPAAIKSALKSIN
jgi:cytosine/adenosine deaminase-related metal-dependent hydrolase